MCLGIPAKIIDIKEDEGRVELGGIKRRINLSLVDDIKIGDYVIVHAGFAITKMDEKEANETLKLLSKISENA